MNAKELKRSQIFNKDIMAMRDSGIANVAGRRMNEHTDTLFIGTTRRGGSIVKTNSNHLYALTHRNLACR